MRLAYLGLALGRAVSSVVEIATGDLRTPDQLRAAQAATLEAMRDGADVIFQATFFDGRWRGHADFLFKRADRPSPGLGDWSYDIADTKLARSVKGGAILQMCVYADLLEGLQGIAPEWLYVITGDRVDTRHRTSRLRGLLPLRPGPVRRPGHRRSGWTARLAPTPTRSTTVGSAPGTRRASTGGAPTTISRSWPGCAAWTRNDLTDAGVPTHAEPRAAPDAIAAIDGMPAPQLAARPRTGPAPAPQEGRPASWSSSSSNLPPTTPAAACRASPSRRHGTCSSTSRPIRGRPRSASNTCSGSSRRSTAQPRYLDIWAHLTGGGEGRLRALHPPRHRSPRRAS